MDIIKITIILTLVQTIKLEVEPCANSMWTESVINDCYTGYTENIEGCARLSLQMTLEKPYTFASYCQCQPSESETSRNVAKLNGMTVAQSCYIGQKC